MVQISDREIKNMRFNEREAINARMDVLLADFVERQRVSSTTDLRI